MTAKTKKQSFWP